jgi:hypothetical protein
VDYHGWTDFINEIRDLWEGRKKILESGRRGKRRKDCGGTRFLLITFDFLFSSKEMVEGAL